MILAITAMSGVVVDMWRFLPLTSFWGSQRNLETRADKVIGVTTIESPEILAAPRAEKQARVSDDVRLNRTLKLRLASPVHHAMLPDEVRANHRIVANQNGEPPPSSMLIR